VTDEAITVELEDGRQVSVPTIWYPRLAHATAKERANYEIDDVGITWPEVEADFSIRGIYWDAKAASRQRAFNSGWKIERKVVA